MTVKVAGHWELSWNTPIKEAELWALPLRDFDVADWFMWPVTGIRQGEQQVNLHERPDLQTILAENEDLAWVFMEPDSSVFDIKATPLTEFTHPEDVLYVFGSAHHNPVAQGLPRPEDAVVKLPTVHNKGVLWPHQVLVATLFHRGLQSWQ